MIRLLLLFVLSFVSIASAKPIVIQLNWKPEPQFGGFYAGVVHGTYQKHDLTVDVRPGGAGTPTVQMVAAGRADYAIVSADELVLARARGMDVVALMAVYQINPQGIITRKSRGFAKIDDVFATPGTLAMQKGLPYALFLEKKFGFDKLQIIPSPFGDLSLYRTRDDYAMQCFVTSEPLAAARTEFEPQAFLIADAGYNPYTTVLVTRKEYLDAHRDEVSRVVKASKEAWQSYLADPALTNKRMNELNPTMSAETFAESAAAQKPLIETEETRTLGIGCMTETRWKTLVDQLLDLKLIEQPIDPNDCFVAVP
jgi:NitT/TauT family transport system substrate-binding protein